MQPTIVGTKSIALALVAVVAVVVTALLFPFILIPGSPGANVNEIRPISHLLHRRLNPAEIHWQLQGKTTTQLDRNGLEKRKKGADVVFHSSTKSK